MVRGSGPTCVDAASYVPATHAGPPASTCTMAWRRSSTRRSRFTARAARPSAPRTAPAPSHVKRTRSNASCRWAEGGRKRCMAEACVGLPYWACASARAPSSPLRADASARRASALISLRPLACACHPGTIIQLKTCALWKKCGASVSPFTEECGFGLCTIPDGPCRSVVHTYVQWPCNGPIGVTAA